MKNLNELTKRIIELRKTDQAQITLLAVCPNSSAVLEAAVKIASLNNMPMLFAATLNQVDWDGGYTGWTPSQFVAELNCYAQKYNWAGPLYPCLDHGGPWLKDVHTLKGLSLLETMNSLKQSLIACIDAGYKLLHIDPTVDRTLPAGSPVPLEIVVERTIELISHAENHISQKGLPSISYEVGTEEVHGGLVDYSRFESFIIQLRNNLEKRNLIHAWPCFVVAQVGTALDTSYFDPDAARRLYDTLSPLGSLAKGHYTDGVENLEAYPQTGMGGANVGPEFTIEEYNALNSLSQKEMAMAGHRKDIASSNFMKVLQQAVLDSGRWKKWLQPEEKGKDFSELTKLRQVWLVQTGCRYIWTDSSVLAAREKLYENLSTLIDDPGNYVVDWICRSMDKYINAFNLFDSLKLLS